MSTIYRAVGPDEGVCICHVHYIQGVGPDEGVCICNVHYIQGCGA